MRASRFYCPETQKTTLSAPSQVAAPRASASTPPANPRTQCPKTIRRPQVHGSDVPTDGRSLASDEG